MKRLWTWIKGWFVRPEPEAVVAVDWAPRLPDATVHLSALLHESQERHRLALQDMVTLREERDRLAVALKGERDRWLGMPVEAPVAQAIVVEYPETEAQRVGAGLFGLALTRRLEVLALVRKSAIGSVPITLPAEVQTEWTALVDKYRAQTDAKKDAWRLQVKNAIAADQLTAIAASPMSDGVKAAFTSLVTAESTVLPEDA